MRDGEDQLRAPITEHVVSEIEELRRDAARCGFERLAQSPELAAQHALEQWRDSQG